MLKIFIFTSLVLLSLAVEYDTSKQFPLNYCSFTSQKNCQNSAVQNVIVGLPKSSVKICQWKGKNKICGLIIQEII